MLGRIPPRFARVPPVSLPHARLAAHKIRLKNQTPNLNNQNANNLFDEPSLFAILELAEKYMGPYEWGKYNVLVLPPSFPYSGMENPCLSFYFICFINENKVLVDIVAHELIHSLSGNLLNNENWSDFWLNEGIITFLLQRKVIKI